MVRDVRVIYTIWLRDLKAFLRDGRIIGMIGQPLIYLLILGQGIASAMTINRRRASATCSSCSRASWG